MPLSNSPPFSGCHPQTGDTCLWKLSSRAPCACAYRLTCDPVGVIAGLGRFERGSLTIRQNGLSLVQSVDLSGRGISGLVHRSERFPLRTVAPGSSRAFYLLTDFADPRPQFASCEGGGKIDVSVRLEGIAWASPEIRRFIAECGGEPVSCGMARDLGAGFWLDDWEQIRAAPRGAARLGEVRALVEDCDELEVGIGEGALAWSTRFKPAFVDADGSILRIADRGCRHVVFAETNTPGLTAEVHSGRTLVLGTTTI